MKRIVGLILIALPLFLAGCVSAPTSWTDMDAKAKEFASDPNKGSVYVYREESVGAPIPIELALNDKKFGVLNNKKFFVLKLSPGDYVLGSGAKNSAGLELTNDSTLALHVEAGKIYFVKLDVGFGLLFASSTLIEENEITGRAQVNQSNLVTTISDELLATGSARQSATSSGGQQSTYNKSTASKNGFVFGTSSVTVEKLAMKRNCQPVSGASLLASNGPIEDYIVKCSDGSELGAHCEYHQCVLK